MSDAGRLLRVVLGAMVCAGAASSAALAADQPPLRDPTRPPYHLAGQPKKEAGAALILYSTRLSASGRSAVINDEIVTVGTHIAGAVVTAIEHGRVTLKRGSEAIVLQLFTQSVKSPARDSS